MLDERLFTPPPFTASLIHLPQTYPGSIRSMTTSQCLYWKLQQCAGDSPVPLCCNPMTTWQEPPTMWHCLHSLMAEYWLKSFLSELKSIKHGPFFLIRARHYYSKANLKRTLGNKKLQNMPHISHSDGPFSLSQVFRNFRKFLLPSHERKNIVTTPTMQWKNGGVIEKL